MKPRNAPHNRHAEDAGESSAVNPYGSAVSEAWARIHPHLARRDPQSALIEWGRSMPTLHACLAVRIEEWLVDLLALPRTEEHNYRDAQGLNRLIYRIWPEIPARSFYPEMLKDVFAAMARIEHRMPGQILDSRAHARADAGDDGVKKGDKT